MNKISDTELILKQMLDDINASNWSKGSSKEDELEKLKNFLNSIPAEKLSQEIQSQIVKNFMTCDLIDKIHNITGETIITYLTKNNISVERIEILFSLYKKKFEPNLEEFLKNEYSKELKIVLLQKVLKQKIIEAKNLEALRLYNKINTSNPQLELEDQKAIIEKNPYYIGEIPTPSAELQLFAAQNLGCPIEILKLVESPSNLLYAYILTHYDYLNPNFEEKFKNGVPKEIIDEVVKLKPGIVFSNSNNIGYEFSSSEKEGIIILHPELFSLIKSSDITPSMVITAIRQLPSNLEHLGENLNLYSQPILDYAKKVFCKEYKPKSAEEDDSINLIIARYQDVIDKRNEVIFEQANIDKKYLNFIKKNKNQ